MRESADLIRPFFNAGGEVVLQPDPRDTGAGQDRLYSSMSSSHISVMRDGAVVLSGETATHRDEQLISAMTPASHATMR